MRPLLTDTDRVVLTLVYQRQHCSQKVLAELLEINPHSIGEAPKEYRRQMGIRFTAWNEVVALPTDA